VIKLRHITGLWRNQVSPPPSGSPDRNSAVAEEAMKGVMRLYGESPRLVNEEEASHEEEDVVQYWHYSAESGDAAAQVCNYESLVFNYASALFRSPWVLSIYEEDLVMHFHINVFCC